MELRPLGHTGVKVSPDVELPDDVFDRIDAIGPPGLNVNPVDGGYQNPDLEPVALRR